METRALIQLIAEKSEAKRKEIHSLLSDQLAKRKKRESLKVLGQKMQIDKNLELLEAEEAESWKEEIYLWMAKLLSILNNCFGFYSLQLFGNPQISYIIIKN